MTDERRPFPAAVEAFERAVRARDADAAEDAFDRLTGTVGEARDAELHAAGPRLSAFLGEVPPGPRATVAVLVGACVERGADPVACAPALFAGAWDAFERAADFCASWKEAGRGGLPSHEGEGLEDADFERFGFEPVMAWQSLPQFEMACVAVLNSPAVRRTAPGRAELRDAVARAAELSGEPFQYLVYALAVLDDEPFVAIDRATGAGFALRASGIGDNFQLHTLLADALIGGGHLPGTAPSPEAAAMCRDLPGQTPTTGSFNLVGADGEWIWNEGNPADVPVVDGVRLLVLDPPPYERGWAAGRFFPGMTGDLVLERVLSAEESRALLAQVAQPGR
ncbi:hypothetical protein GCM10010497_51260 [Streptomyces cinereoruber]|uniref:Uncharacterized protein n=1 Tax=Streptomyces cinereoruber TaxID=67260 RepID=A0AAV4KRF8_9ACTN|nr:hypothetical protein [Streptomyces cinereoruber]MBB4156038.1 hypothetical protein [Streptomyces cinereoruber]MBY8819540.1 hypothetical protein [Streptomyces cinereoruber]NIH64849.1 hypothetical protein [Streptomyces cinereoruber]QEV32528.1 hypothetical protein CP977_10330 [Streptomyces cinereoruber]GGR41701.1 hypothetical protein GCM10010497_51260 [Streptomyces cinereoruber]